MKVKAIVATTEIDLNRTRFSLNALHSLVHQAPHAIVLRNFDAADPVGRVLFARIVPGLTTSSPAVEVEAELYEEEDPEIIEALYLVPGYRLEEAITRASVREELKLRLLCLGTTKKPTDISLEPMQVVEA